MGQKRITDREWPSESEPLPEFVHRLSKDETRERWSHYPQNIESYGWDGGHEDGVRRLTDDECRAWLNADLGEHSALEQAMLALIDRYPAKTQTKPGQKNAREKRLARAMKELTQKPLQRGQERLSEDELTAIARKYAAARLDFDGAPDHQEELIYDLRKAKTVSEDRKSVIRRPKEQFEEQFQRLMFKVTSGKTEEQRLRAVRIRDVIKQLFELIDTSRPSKITKR